VLDKLDVILGTTVYVLLWLVPGLIILLFMAGLEQSISRRFSSSNFLMKLLAGAMEVVIALFGIILAFGTGGSIKSFLDNAFQYETLTFSMMFYTFSSNIQIYIKHPLVTSITTVLVFIGLMTPVFTLALWLYSKLGNKRRDRS
jgi:hypothetical protein